MQTQVCLQCPRPDGKGFELLTRVVADLDPIHKSEYGCGGYRVKVPAVIGLKPGHLLINYGGIYRIESVTPIEGTNPPMNLYLALRDDTVLKP